MSMLSNNTDSSDSKNNFEDDDNEIPISEISVAKFEALNTCSTANVDEKGKSCLKSAGEIAFDLLIGRTPDTCSQTNNQQFLLNRELHTGDGSAEVFENSHSKMQVDENQEDREEAFDFEKYREEAFGTDPDIADGVVAADMSSDNGDDPVISSVSMQELNLKLEGNGFVDVDGKKKWECHLCTKVYSTKHNLMIHVLDHSGVKMHSCHICRRRFKQHSHLRAHLLIHSNIRPHACTVCSKAFTQVT